MVDLVCGFFLVVGCGPIWLWFMGVFFFSFCFLVVVGGDLVRLLVAGGGDGGWMWWLGYGWVDAVADGAENNWVEKQRDKGEREKKK